MTEFRLAIRVRPGAARASVGGTHGDALVVRVCERAVDGNATEAALRAVARALGVKRRDVRLVTGPTSRDKVVAVDVGPAGEADAVAVLVNGLRAAGGGRDGVNGV
jgi:uncharacterized protein YggU (UPF0235/DUF167 family)